MFATHIYFIEHFFKHKVKKSLNKYSEFKSRSTHVNT